MNRPDDEPSGDLYAEDLARGGLLPDQPIPYRLTEMAIAAIRRNHARGWRGVCRSPIHRSIHGGQS